MQTHTEIGYNSKIEGAVVHTRLDAALNWFRKNSLWPMPMGLACCGSSFEDAASCPTGDSERDTPATTSADVPTG